MERYSYSSATWGLKNRLTEAVQLIKMARRPTSSGVDWVLSLHEQTQRRVFELTGLQLHNLKGLDIGPGQQLGCLRCFATHNDMVAIDTDVIAQGLNPIEYVRMFRQNSGTRTVKTLARKALGVDSRFRRELAQRLGVDRIRPVRVLRMSATNMQFADDSFDFIYSHSVFEHIDDPEQALREVARVLRPGGAAYIGIHLYTSHSGCHDPRILAQGRPVPPLWPHLLPAHQHTIFPNAYLNKLRIPQWREMFQRTMPGATMIHDRQDAEIGDGLRALREAGELAEYTDEELMTVNYIGVWRKPEATPRIS